MFVLICSYLVIIYVDFELMSKIFDTKRELLQSNGTFRGILRDE